MPTDAGASEAAEGARGAVPAPGFDVGLLTPVAAGVAEELSDAAIAGALVAAEVGLARAWATVGAAPEAAVAEISDALGWRGAGAPCAWGGLPLAELVTGAVAGGNPVIPLVGILRAGVAAEARPWVHRGATSQDILDSALMLSARAAGELIGADLRRCEASLTDFAREHRDLPAAARTLTQHAVPTTLGLRASGWLRGVSRAADRLAAAVAQLP
ncbi:lyase family protein, partial [Leucobacter chromiireducens]|uniref:lyase family protein n=1 Tax=Leucobacter chromiireducens TaxID=283877 RepID=UPI001F1502DA